MQANLTPRQLAEAIGVSESSVKRWVDEGHIDAARTAGGHRRIPVREALRYVRDKSIPLLRPDLLGLPELEASVSQRARSERSAERLFDYLRAGAEKEASGLLVTEYLQGRSVAEIVDGPLRESMGRLGDLWTHDPSAIVWEHRATQIAIQALGRLRSVLEVPAEAPIAVGGAPSGDTYVLPSMAAAAVLEGEGLRAVNLGSETPISALEQALEALGAKIAWLSVTIASHPERLRDEIVAILPRLDQLGVPLVIGGSKIDRLRLPRHGLLFVGRSMVELAALVRGMRLTESLRA